MSGRGEAWHGACYSDGMIMKYECSGRGESGVQDMWGCRREAVAGFVSASGTQQRKVFLFCGVEHRHPCMKPLDVLVSELLGSPRVVGEPFHPSIDTSGCPAGKLP